MTFVLKVKMAMLDNKEKDVRKQINQAKAQTSLNLSTKVREKYFMRAVLEKNLAQNSDHRSVFIVIKRNQCQHYIFRNFRTRPKGYGEQVIGNSRETNQLSASV